ASDEKEQRKYKIVEAEALPRDMTHLSAEEAADRAQCRALAFQHPVKGQDRTIATNDPEYTEPAQRIDRYDAVGLQGERHIYVTHRAQVAISSKALAGRKQNGCQKSSWSRLWRRYSGVQ